MAKVTKQVVQESSSIVRHKCSNCNMSYKNRLHLSRHKALCSLKVAKFSCSKCSTEFTRKDSLSLHEKNVQSQK